MLSKFTNCEVSFSGYWWILNNFGYFIQSSKATYFIFVTFNLNLNRLLEVSCNSKFTNDLKLASNKEIQNFKFLTVNIFKTLKLKQLDMTFSYQTLNLKLHYSIFVKYSV